MNFPGLEFVWNSAHRALRSGGVIQPWNLEETRAALERGARVLVVAPTALGDSILCTPLLRTLGDALGPDRVGFLVRKPFAELYEDTPWFGRVYSTRGKFRGLGNLRRELDQTGYEIALVANCTEPDLVPWLWWCGVRGFLRYRSRWSTWAGWFANRGMMRLPNDPLYATGHAVENNLAMAEALGIPATSHRLEIFLGNEPVPPPENSKSLVMIHPGASRPGKCWPLERWAEVASKLGEQFDCRFAITGSASERPQAEKLRRLMTHDAENLAGEFGLRELARRQRSAALFLSGDTGPYHLAVAVGCPTVTLFAPRDRGSSVEACGPNGLDGRFHAALETADFNDPVEAIPVDAVLEKSMEVLEQSIAAK